MPRLLAQRAEGAYDCIATVRNAADLRFHEGLALRRQRQWTSAIYLMGYAIEMCVKSAVFQLDGFTARQAITLQDMRRLVRFGCAQYGLSAPRNLHDFAFWTLLLVQHRLGLARPFRNPTTAQEVVRRSQETYRRWREILRYRTNVPYRHEVARVADNARWFLDRIDQL